jgi:hypothetical protein
MAIVFTFGGALCAISASLAYFIEKKNVYIKTKTAKYKAKRGIR